MEINGENLSRVCRKAVEAFGIENQIIVAIEELSELQKALCKYLRDGGSEEVLDNIAEEFADVLIMIAQLPTVFPGVAIDVDGWMEKKLDRLEKLVDEYHEKG